MKKNLVTHILIICVLCIFPACATIPKESAELSIELTRMIRAAEQSHLAMLDQFIVERKQRTNDFIDKTWAPKFMENAMKDTKIMALIEQERDAIQKAVLLTEFSQDAAAQVWKRRATLIDAIDEIGRALRETVASHYSDMLTVNQALTAHLRSAAEVTETRQKLLAGLKVDPAALLPLDKVNGILEKILTYQGKAEEVTTYIEEAKTILKGK